MEIQLSDVTMHPKGTPAPASSVEAQVFEERVDLSNDMTGRQMIAVGIRYSYLFAPLRDWRHPHPSIRPGGLPPAPACPACAG